MSLFWKKFITALVAVITFGVITPSHEIWSNVFEPPTITYSEMDDRVSVFDPNTLVMKAEEQSILKFGVKIQPKIESKYMAEIFPLYQQKIYELATEDSAISSKPSGDHGEKIFHLYDEVTGKDMLRAHVRVEKRPKDGYFFTFHYHTADDDFMSHKDIGEIYWSKNTPPKWMS